MSTVAVVHHSRSLSRSAVAVTVAVPLVRLAFSFPVWLAVGDGGGLLLLCANVKESRRGETKQGSSESKWRVGLLFPRLTSFWVRARSFGASRVSGRVDKLSTDRRPPNGDRDQQGADIR